MTQVTSDGRRLQAAFGPIEEATMALGEHDYVDVWARRRKASMDEFEWRRFTDCRVKRNYPHNPREGLPYHVVGLDDGWRAVHWVRVPVPPGAK